MLKVKLLALCGILLFCLFTATAVDIDLSGAQPLITNTDTFTITNVGALGAYYWVDYKWNPYNARFTITGVGPESYAGENEAVISRTAINLLHASIGVTGRSSLRIKDIDAAGGLYWINLDWDPVNHYFYITNYGKSVYHTFVHKLGRSDHDLGNDIRQTADGGYIAVGNTTDPDDPNGRNVDMLLIKFNAVGAISWYKLIGGDKYDTGNAVYQTDDGGYIITGTSKSYTGTDEKVWLVKTDAAGNVLFNKIYQSGTKNEGHSVKQTDDGGYIIGGVRTDPGSVWGNKNLLLIKTDADGEILWERSYGGDMMEIGYDVAVLRDGGYALLGKSESYGAGGIDAYLIKTDADGNKLWEKTYGGALRDDGNALQQTADDGFIIAGTTHSYGIEEGQMWLIKTDADGNEIWNTTYGNGIISEGFGVQETINGGFVAIGTIGTGGQVPDDALLVKTDANGTQLFEKTYGTEYLDRGKRVIQAYDDGYIFIGDAVTGDGARYDMWIQKTDVNGNMQE